MASLSGVRVNLFNENFLNETEQDANSVLTELDKNLRSGKLGVQCEAIVRFPRIFEKYPFPILINSSFLKLAEFFWNGSNLLRFWVLRVCQQSENHLDKILNIDEFLKRIFMVIHSNDAVARALTLRTLGAVSRVIPEKQQVHHAIRRALDSHDTVEVEAAIFASAQFAAQSRSFSISMCAKITDMIESLQIPVPMKLQLIPVLQHMHHDAKTATLVRELCLKLLPKYPAEGFVVAILDSLTQLSARILVGIPDQVHLLLKFLMDERKAVRAQALSSLALLADVQCVHAWPKPATVEIIANAKKCQDSREQYLYLSIVLKLCHSTLTCNTFLTEQRDSLLELCTECISIQDYATAGQALAIFAALVVYAGDDHVDAIGIIKDMIDMHMESLLFCTIKEKNYRCELRNILACGIRVASVDTEFGINFVNLLACLLSDDVVYPAKNLEMICDALGALCEQFQIKKFSMEKVTEEPMETDQPIKATNLNPVLECLPLILHKLKAIINVEPRPSDEHLHAVEILAAVTLQSLMGCFVPIEVIEDLKRCCARTNGWTQYRIARSASRYGHHFLAAHITGKLTCNTVLDKHYFFLMGLQQLSEAECLLNYSVDYKTLTENYVECNPHVLNDYNKPTTTNMTTADVASSSTAAVTSTTSASTAVDATDATTALKTTTITTTTTTTTTQSKVKLIPLMQRLEAAINLYWQSLASFRASSSAAHPFNFQLEFLQIRAQFLQTLHMAVMMKNVQIIVPPPAIAGSIAQNARDYLLKFGYVTLQLRKLAKNLNNCKESFTRLYAQAFDADPVTLEFLELAEYQCALFEYIIQTICYATPADTPPFLVAGQHPETRYFTACCRRMELLYDKLPKEEANAKTISNEHLEVVIAIVELIIRTPLCLPRFFFQVLQSTHIKLSVSPQPRSPGEPVIVQSGSNLVIKVEGVIQHYGRKRSMFRSVAAVKLILISQLVTPKPLGELMKPNTDMGVKLEQIVKPQRDFLSASFLLPISSGGQWQVSLETSSIDENGFKWNTGPKNSMLVRVLDDPTKPATPAPTQTGQTRRF